jgi:hypothetical protein
VPGDLLCALFVNVTEPTVDFQIDGAEFDLYRDVKRESARAAAQDEDPRAGAIGFPLHTLQASITGGFRFRGSTRSCPHAVPQPSFPSDRIVGGLPYYPTTAFAGPGSDHGPGCVPSFPWFARS